jgi:hypothetical protein
MMRRKQIKFPDTDYIEALEKAATLSTALSIGKPLHKFQDNYEREYDKHGNWIKQAISKWNPETGKSDLAEVYYRTITYYER